MFRMFHILLHQGFQPFNHTKNKNDVSKFKVCRPTTYNSNVGKMAKFVFGWVEIIVGKEENAGYQHFLLFSQCFPKASLSALLKVGVVW